MKDRKRGLEGRSAVGLTARIANNYLSTPSQILVVVPNCRRNAPSGGYPSTLSSRPFAPLVENARTQ